MAKNLTFLEEDPFSLFDQWYTLACHAQLKYPDAMTLSTATSQGIPSARVVLLKGYDKKGFRFFTNYQSRKGNELLKNPHAALTFYWPSLDKQIRIEGKTALLSSSESDQYWDSRHKQSQIHSLASKQSAPLHSKKELEKKVSQLEKKYSHLLSIPRPEHWGGFRLIPKRIEFWQEGSHRLHDRFLFEKKKTLWVKSILSP